MGGSLGLTGGRTQDVNPCPTVVYLRYIQGNYIWHAHQSGLVSVDGLVKVLLMVK